MLKKFTFMSIITGLIGLPMVTTSLTGCTASKASSSSESERFIPLLDGNNPDPTKAYVVLTAKPGSQVIYKDSTEGGGSWDKVEIKNMELWIDRGYLYCEEKTQNSTCEIIIPSAR